MDSSDSTAQTGAMFGRVSRERYLPSIRFIVVIRDTGIPSLHFGTHRVLLVAC